MSQAPYKVWECRLYVQAHINLPSGADGPFRAAVRSAAELSGLSPKALFSGWNAPVKEIEIAVIENRLPADPLPGMSDMNREIAYSAAQKLRELGYAWDGKQWKEGD